MSSTNGVNWTRQATTTNGFYGRPYNSSIAYGNGQFVMVGLGGTILTSADGMSWNQRSSGTTNDLSAIAFSGNRFVVGGGTAAGPDFRPILLTSTNGIDWVQQEPPPGFFGNNGFGMAYGNGRFVMAGFGFAATSTNGLDWVEQILPVWYPATGITFGNGRFILVGSGASILTSIDGINWSGTGTQEVLTSVAFGGGRFVAVGSPGLQWQDAMGIIMTSADGVHWDRHEVLRGASLWGVVYGNGRFVAVGDFETILESGSIIDLALRRQPNTGLLSLSLDGPMALDCTIQASPDLSSWQSLTNLNTGQTGKTILTVPANSKQFFYRALPR
jgi:hypothetical protein